MEKIYEFKKGETIPDMNLIRWNLMEHFCQDGVDFEIKEFAGGMGRKSNPIHPKRFYNNS